MHDCHHCENPAEVCRGCYEREVVSTTIVAPEVSEVLYGDRRRAFATAKWEDFLPSLPDGCVDLVFGSPPYEAARTYGIDFKLRGQAWVDWMVALFREATRVCRGLVAMVLEGQTRNYRWSAVPALLMADLHRAGFNLRKPPIYRRVGIPGSGGPDWLRNDYEFIICVTPPGRLPWSDNTAAGHPPKWAPGGAMAHRLANGARVNQRGGRSASGSTRRTNGERQPPGRPSHAIITPPLPGQHSQESTSYAPPVLANPGNVIACTVGGGQMGSSLAHENEAPYPETLVEPFVLSFCPPDGIVLDPFLGSGTTAAVAIREGRRALGCDIRQSQVDLATRRIDAITPTMFAE